MRVFTGAFTETFPGAFLVAFTAAFTGAYVARRDVSPYVSLRLLTSRRKPLRFLTFAYVTT